MKKQYGKTHGHTEPGQQKDREYNWKFDKNNHHFGLPQTIEFDGAKKSLFPENYDHEFVKSNIGEKRIEDYRRAKIDLVGKPKFHGSMPPGLADNFVFGVKSLNEKNTNAGY